MTVLLVRNNDCQHTDGNLMLALYSKDCAGFMSRRLKFTTWMCQLTRQMCSYHDIYHILIHLRLNIRRVCHRALTYLKDFMDVCLICDSCQLDTSN